MPTAPPGGAAVDSAPCHVVGRCCATLRIAHLARQSGPATHVATLASTACLLAAVRTACRPTVHCDNRRRLCWLLQLPLLTILCFSVRKHDFSKKALYTTIPSVYWNTSRLEYASSADRDPYTARDYRLDKVQRRAARFVKRDYRRTTSVSELISQLGRRH